MSGQVDVGARPEPAKDPGDGPLRLRLFWSVLLGALGLLVASHTLERALTYQLEPAQELIYGGYGLGLAKPRPSADHPRVLLLGNSVYQHERLPELMQQLTHVRGRPLELVNLAQVGSGLEDYLVQAAWTADEPRALTVVCLGYVSIGAAEVRFRTDARRYAFDQRLLRRLPASFYRRNFDLKQAADSACATILPHQRVDPILRHRISESDLAQPSFLFDRLQFPRLNLGRNRIIADFLRGRPGAFEWWNDTPQTGWEQAFDELLALLGRLGPVLVIWQEARPSPHSGPVLSAMSQRSREQGVGLVDLERHWTPERFRDPIHPTPAERPRQALRHLIAIERALANASANSD